MRPHLLGSPKQSLVDTPTVLYEMLAAYLHQDRSSFNKFSSTWLIASGRLCRSTAQMPINNASQQMHRSIVGLEHDHPTYSRTMLSEPAKPLADLRTQRVQLLFLRPTIQGNRHHSSPSASSNSLPPSLFLFPTIVAAPPAATSFFFSSVASCFAAASSSLNLRISSWCSLSSWL